MNHKVTEGERYIRFSWKHHNHA